MLNGLEVAKLSYLALLKSGHDYRTHIQRELCMLRDYIAQETGKDAEEVQDHYESRAQYEGKRVPSGKGAGL